MGLVRVMWPIFRSSLGDDLIGLLNSGVSVRTSTKRFSDFNVIWCVGRPRPDMRTSVTSTQSKVSVTELLKFQKLHFPRSISYAILAGSSKWVVDNDSMGPSLQLVGARLSNFVFKKATYHVSSNSPNVDIRRISLLRKATVTWSGILVVLYVLCMLMWHWSDPRSHQHSAPPFWCGTRKLMADHDSIEPTLQAVRARFLNFLLRELSREFKLRGMSISRKFQMAIFPHCLSLRSHGRTCW